MLEFLQPLQEIEGMEIQRRTKRENEVDIRVRQREIEISFRKLFVGSCL